MTRRRSLTAALAFLGVIGVLLIPSAGGAATLEQRLARIGARATTTTTTPVADPAADPADAQQADAAPQPAVADATLPGFTFPPLTFGGFTFPGFTFPPIQIPDFFSNLLQSVFNSVEHILCSIFGGTFCASP